MAILTLPGEVRRAFESAIAEATTWDYDRGRATLDEDHAWDQFVDNLEAEGFQITKKPPP